MSYSDDVAFCFVYDYIIIRIETTSKPIHNRRRTYNTQFQKHFCEKEYYQHHSKQNGIKAQKPDPPTNSINIQKTPTI